MTERAAHLVTRAQRLKDGRGNWESLWNQLAENFRPFAATFLGEREDGFKGTEHMYDGTPLQAVRNLAVALDWLLKPRGEKWFKLKALDDDLNSNDAVREWMELAEELLAGALYAPAAHFVQASGEVDIGLAVFGTGPLYFDIAPSGRSFRFLACSLRDVLISEDANGQIDTVFRPLWLTARQAAQRFTPQKLSRELREVLERDSGSDKDRKWKFLHAVCPRDEAGLERKEQKGREFGSLYIEWDQKHEVSVGGYDGMPYIVPRWETAAGEIYGRSPGMLALPDARTLNAMAFTNLKQGQMAANPPLLMPDEGAITMANLYPGGSISYDAELAVKMRGIPVREMQIGQGLSIGLEMENQRRQMVNGAFLSSVLQLPTEGPQMTAEEIRARRQEFIRNIGPVGGRLEGEYTAPIVERGFRLLLERNLLPEPPEELQGREVKFEYESPISQARRGVEVAGLMSTFQQLMPLVQADPTVLDHLDQDAIARDVPGYNGVPAKWVRSEDQVAEMRARRAEAIQAQQQAAQLAQAAELAPGVATAAQKVGLVPANAA